MEIRVEVGAKPVARFLSLIICALVIASVIATLMVYYWRAESYLGSEAQESFVRLFFLDYEANVPTWFSSSILLISSALLAVITLAKRAAADRYTLHWGILALGFLYLSLDEAAVLHEMAIVPMQTLFDLGGLFYYGWIIPALLVLVVLLVMYLRFFLHFQGRTRWLFLAAGLIYVGGAIGVEAISGQYAEQFGEVGLIYDLIITVEELFEMSGVVLFIYALLDYLSKDSIRMNISFRNDTPIQNHNKQSD